MGPRESERAFRGKGWGGGPYAWRLLNPDSFKAGILVSCQNPSLTTPVSLEQSGWGCGFQASGSCRRLSYHECWAFMGLELH